MAHRILVVEDEIDLVQVIRYQLVKDGFDVDVATRGSDALKAVRTPPHPDIILLDLMLPDMSGKDICRILKSDPQVSHIPILMVTARGEEIDRIIGFELGADDYVVKPFSTRELILRIRAILKTVTQTADTPAIQETGALRLDTESFQATLDGARLDLTVLEFKLLSTLMKNPGRVLSRAQLLEQVWDDPLSVTERTVDSVMKRMRVKLGGSASNLETVRGIGYRFRGADTK